MQLQESDGFSLLTSAPAYGVQFGSPARSQQRQGRNKYLWVIDTRGIPYVFEIAIASIGNVPKHTNLTGGGKAYLGGELWFRSASSLYLSGGSGRYHPTGPAQLDDAAKVFESFGYEVTSLGWDYQEGKAKRYLEKSA